MRNTVKRPSRIVSIVGWSGAGKTTFIESALEECSKRGISAAAIKKSRHEADLPPDTKDSARFFAAGANPSIYLSESEMVVLAAPPALMDAGAIAALCPLASIIFCEGLAAEGALRVLVAGAETEEKALKRPLADIDILVAREPAMLELAKTRNIKAFRPDNIEFLIDYIIS